jgi:hypothetical protein
MRRTSCVLSRSTNKKEVAHPLSQQEKNKLFNQFKHWPSERPEPWHSLVTHGL